MRLIFAGTPEFARVALEHLHRAGHAIALVLTQPDRPAGRGLKAQLSAVKQFALQHGMPVEQPRSLRLDGKFPADAAAAREAILDAHADLMIVAAYGLILPQWVLDAPARGCLNVHASLLPRWRGAAPIHRAIEAGDARTGITIMRMDAGLDTGDMLLVQSVDIVPHETTGSLHDRLAALGGEAIVQALDGDRSGELRPQKQPEAGVTYAHKIDKAEAAIDWTQDAVQIERRIRAFDPFPGATARLGEQTIKLWRAQLEGFAAAVDARPGTVISADADGIRVACGRGRDGATATLLRITELQRAGARRMAAGDFLRGFAVHAGMAFQ